MSAVAAFARWPRRLQAGAAGLAVLALVAVAGPWFTANPDAIVDARAAALLPPGATRFGTPRLWPLTVVIPLAAWNAPAARLRALVS